MQYTPAQQCAISFPDKNLLLSAAAGSGKTATLTARILSLLREDKARLSQMLIVTYTRAAAAELRERITKSITEEARETGSRKMARHLTDLPGAEICTIHAFLYRVLRPSFAALGLSPDFTIGDESVVDTLKADAMRDTLDDFFSAGEEDFIRLADTLAGTADSLALDRTLLGIYAKITAAGQNAEVLHTYANTLRTADGFFSLPQSRPLRDRLYRAVSHYRQAVFSLRSEFTEIVESKYGPAADEMYTWLQQAEERIPQGDYTQIRELLHSYTSSRLKNLNSQDATPESDAFKALRERWKKDLKYLQDRYFADSEEQVNRSLVRTADLLDTCGRVLAAYAETFRQRKCARSLLDYNDLEALALRLFLDEEGKPTGAAEEVGSQYRYIFVDEYQDTNRVQDSIFGALGQHTPRFMVGDSKQSIYSFRGAEPSVFAGYRDVWPVWEDMSDPREEESPWDPAAGYCLFMSENFRCDKPVVDFVNLVAEYVFPHSRMPYTPQDALRFGKGEGDSIPAEVVLVEKNTKNAADLSEDEEELSALDPEAEYVAERIASMLGEGEQLSDGKVLSPDDIVILLRSPESNAAPFRDALLRRGIPVRLQNTKYLFTSPAIRLVMCLAHIADNPLHDIPAAGAMHSPLFGFKTHELVMLRDWSREILRRKYGWNGDMPLYYTVRMAVEEEWDFAPQQEEYAESREDDKDTSVAFATDVGDEAGFTEWNTPWDTEFVTEDPREDPLPILEEALAEKCRVFYQAVEELRQMAHGMRANTFLDTVYRKYALLDLPEIAGNPMEKNNLLALYDLARRYETGHFGGVSGFVAYAEELQTKEREHGNTDSLPAVTILSIHKSKGLEFPVVFVSACSKQRNTNDEEGDILYDPDLGVGMRLPDEGGHVRCGTALRCSIAEKKRLNSIEEEMRVLYVALTRARNRLIITGKVADAEKFLEACRQEALVTTDYSIESNAVYLKWILTAALRHGPDPCWRLLTVERQNVQEKTAVSSLENTACSDTEVSSLDVEDWEAVLGENLRFRYPWEHLANVPAKLTVSRLHGAVLDSTDALSVSDLTEEEEYAADRTAEEEKADFRREDACIERTAPLPRFMGGIAERAAAERGTATHTFLQFVDFSALRENGVQAELTRLTKQHFLSKQTAEQVYVSELERFRSSDLFARMCEAALCKREFRFNVPMDAWRFTEDPLLAEKLKEENTRLIVQGVVDCIFRDRDGKLTLVDYKTDRPLAEEYKNPALADARFILRHQKQLLYYREICASMFREEIGKTVIYSTALAREIPIHTEETLQEI